MRIFLALLIGLLVNTSKLSPKEIEEVRNSGVIKVLGSSQSQQSENEQKCCFSIEVEHKNKRKGYQKTKKKYNNIRNYLIIKQIIHDRTSFQLLKQQIRMNNKRKVWHFKRIVCVLTNEQEESYLRKSLKKYHISKISFGFPTDVTQQDLLMKAFNDANQKAKQLLDKINYRIIKIQSITILNDQIEIQYPQTDYSSLQYDPEVSAFSEQVKKSTSTQEKNRKDHKEVQDVEVEIIFSVRYAGNQEEEESSSQEEAHSQLHNRRSKESQDNNNEDSSQQL